MAIPRVIHQTYPVRALPPELAANVEQLRRMNPGWTHQLYDDAAIEDFIRSEYKPAYLQAYRRIDPRYGAARADFFRYLLLYRRGGVYLDIKSSTTVPLDQSLAASDRCVLAYWPNRLHEDFPEWGVFDELPDLPRGEFQNWHLISEPMHPFMHAAVEYVLGRIRTYDAARDGTGRMAVLRTTGPIAFTKAVLPLMPTHPHRLAGTHLDLGLRYSILDHQGAGAHWRLLPTHYSRLDCPVVAYEPI